MDIFIDNKPFEAPERLTKEFLDKIEREFDIKYFNLTYEDRVMKEGDDIFPGEYSLVYSDIKKRMSKFKSLEHAQELWFKCTDPEDVPVFIEYGIDVNSKDFSGKTLLLLSLDLRNSKSEEMTYVLIKHGADIKLDNLHENYCLFDAIIMKNERLVKKFIEEGADVNFESDFGNRPLFKACQCECEDIAEMLIVAGANMENKSFGRTPLGKAIECRYNACFDILLKYGAKIDKDMIKLAKVFDNQYALDKFSKIDLI